MFDAVLQHRGYDMGLDLTLISPLNFNIMYYEYDLYIYMQFHVYLHVFIFEIFEDENIET